MPKNLLRRMFLSETAFPVSNTPQDRRIALRTELRHFTKNDEDKTYDQLAAELNVSKGVLWKFVNKNYVPDDLVISRKLGIPKPELIPQYRSPLGQFEKR